MSSTANIGTILDSATYHFNFATGIFVFIFGIIGNSLNIIIFISLKTFRKNPCAFSLLILSISDSGMLLFSIIPNILNNIFQNNSSVNMTFVCKITTSFPQTFILISHCIMCLAAIDQCLSTSMNERLKRMSITVIRRLILISIFACILHSIPFLIYYNAQILPGTNITSCRVNDNDGPFSKYILYVGVPIVGGFLPIFIMTLFALIALRNVRKMTKRNIHIIRLRSEQQLTAMILIKIFSVYFTVVPFLIAYIVRYIASFHSNDPLVQKIFLLASRVFNFLLLINYANGFYIFSASSARFRRQLKFVVFDIYCKQWRAKRNMNRVHPNVERFFVSINSGYEFHQ